MGRVRVAAELRYVDAEVVGLGLVGGSPYVLQQLLPADQLAGITDENFQQAPLGRCQTNRPFGRRDLLRCKVDCEAFGLHGCRSTGRGH